MLTHTGLLYISLLLMPCVRCTATALTDGILQETQMFQTQLQILQQVVVKAELKHRSQPTLS